MNKFFNKIIGASLAIAMMIGVGVAVNSSKQTSPVFASTATYSATTYSSGNITGTGVTWTGTGVGGTSYVVLKSGASLTSNGFTGIDLTQPVKFTINTRTYGGSDYKTSIVRAYSDASCSQDITGTPATVTASGSSFSDKKADLTFADNAAASNVYFKITSSTTSSSNGPGIKQITFSYTEASSFGTLNHIKVNTPANKLAFEVGETFTSEGLTLTGYDGQDESASNSQSYATGFTTNPEEGYKFVADDIGEKEVTITYSEKTTTYTIQVVAGPDYVLDGTSNTPAGISSSENSDVSEGQVNSSGVKYGYYAIQKYSGNLEFNKSVAGAYIGNNESYGKFINKVRITLPYDSFNRLKVFKGNTAIPSSTEIFTTETGVVRTYDLGNDSEFFALTQATTASTYVQISRIDIFLGSDVPVVESVLADLKTRTYYSGEALSCSDFEVVASWTGGKADTEPADGFTWTIKNNNNNGVLAVGTNEIVVNYQGVDSNTIEVVAEAGAAKDVIAFTQNTQAALSYAYATEDAVVTDTLTKAFTTVSGSSYTAWENKEGSSGAVYAGKTSGGNNTANYIQMKNGDNTGIITTASDRYARKVTVTWNSSTTTGRTIDVYGKNTAYSATSNLFSSAASTQGTKLGSIVCGTSTSITINDDYKYIGIRAKDGALYVDDIKIDWFDSLSYKYSNVAIRFGGMIQTSLWNELNGGEEGTNIQGYGVMLAPTKSLGSTTIEDMYKTAEAVFEPEEFFNVKDGVTFIGDTSIKYFYNSISTEPATLGNYYFWNLYKNISNTDIGLAKSFTAVAFIKTANDGMVFLRQESKSAAQLAAEKYNANPDMDETYEGSLSNMAKLYQAN